MTTVVSGMMSQYYTYFEFIKVVGSGSNEKSSLYDLVNMLKDLRHFNIGAVI